MINRNFFVFIFVGIFIPSTLNAPNKNENGCNLFKILCNLKKKENALLAFQAKDKKCDKMVNYYIKYIPRARYEQGSKEFAGISILYVSENGSEKKFEKTFN